MIRILIDNYLYKLNGKYNIFYISLDNSYIKLANNQNLSLHYLSEISIDKNKFIKLINKLRNKFEILNNESLDNVLMIENDTYSLDYIINEINNLNNK